MTPPDDYIPPVHVYVLNKSKASNRDVEFWIAAANIQMRDHVAPTWGRPPCHAVLYQEDVTPDEELAGKAGSYARMVVVDDAGDADAQGYHTALGGVPDGFVDLSRSETPSEVFSHELIETWGNWKLDRYFLNQGVDRYWAELCDPVQGTSYEIEVELFGEKRRVKVADFVTPSWFGWTLEAHSATAWSTLWLRPFEIRDGGYASVERDGRTVTMGVIGSESLSPVSRLSRMHARARQGAWIG